MSLGFAVAAAAQSECEGCKLEEWSTPAGPSPYSVTVTFGAGTGSGYCQAPTPCTAHSPCQITFLSYQISADYLPFDGQVRVGSAKAHKYVRVRIEQESVATFYVGEDGDDPYELACGGAGWIMFSVGNGDLQHGLLCTACPE